MKRSWTYVLLAFTIVLVSCQEEKPEVIDINDILPDSRLDENAGDEIMEDTGDSLVWIKKQLSEAELAYDSIRQINDKEFPDRFGCENTWKFILTQEGEEVRFYRWNYSDSSKTINAFYNWIDCYGKNCRSIFVGEERNFQTDAFRIWVNDTSLIFVDSPGEIDSKVWDRVFEKQGFEKDWGIVVEQRRKGRAKWFTYEEEKKVPFKKK